MSRALCPQAHLGLAFAEVGYVFDRSLNFTNGRPTTAVRTAVGNPHCGWESTVMLFLDGDTRLYIRDPLGVLREIEVGRFAARISLPIDAVASGYMSVDRELFTTADESSVYIRTPAGVERWPRSKDSMIGCA